MNSNRKKSLLKNNAKHTESDVAKKAAGQEQSTFRPRETVKPALIAKSRL